MGINGTRQQSQMVSELVTGETPPRRSPQSKPCPWDVQRHPWSSSGASSGLSPAAPHPADVCPGAGGVSPERGRTPHPSPLPTWGLSPARGALGVCPARPSWVGLEGSAWPGAREVTIPGMWHKEPGMAWEQLPGRESEELSASIRGMRGDRAIIPERLHREKISALKVSSIK